MLCLLVFSGCGEASKWDRVPLAGTVTLDGATVGGSISLRPQRPVRGPTVSAKIQDGNYRFGKSDGPVVGEHTAIFMPTSEFGSRSDVQINCVVTVPSEKPFELNIDFETPSDAAAPPASSVVPEAEESAK